jgi:hypothetical protein
MNRLSGVGARPRPCGTTIVTEPAPDAPKTGTGNASGLHAVLGRGRISPTRHEPGAVGRISSAPDAGGKRTRRRLRSIMAPRG